MDFKALRKRQDLSLREAAEKIGVSFQSICRYENKNRVPTDKVLLKMTKVYNCTEKELGQAILNNIRKKEEEQSWKVKY